MHFPWLIATIIIQFLVKTESKKLLFVKYNNKSFWNNSPSSTFRFSDRHENFPTNNIQRSSGGGGVGPPPPPPPPPPSYATGRALAIWFPPEMWWGFPPKCDNTKLHCFGLIALLSANQTCETFSCMTHNVYSDYVIAISLLFSLDSEAFPEPKN